MLEKTGKNGARRHSGRNFLWRCAVLTMDDPGRYKVSPPFTHRPAMQLASIKASKAALLRERTVYYFLEFKRIEGAGRHSPAAPRASCIRNL